MINKIFKSLPQSKGFYIFIFFILCAGGSLQAEIVPSIFKDAYAKYNNSKEIFFGVLLPIIGVGGCALKIGSLYIHHKYLMILPCVIVGILSVYVENIVDALFAVKSMLIG